MAPLKPKPPDLCHRAASFSHGSPSSSRSKPSHKCFEPDALEVRNKHSSRVVGTRIEFSEPLDEGYYELDVFHHFRPTKIWPIFATQMTLRVGSGGQKLGPHCIDRRLATPIARSASPNTKWVFPMRFQDLCSDCLRAQTIIVSCGGHTLVAFGCHCTPICWTKIPTHLLLIVMPIRKFGILAQFQLTLNYG